MLTLNYRIISIGSLARHPLWNEPRDLRTGHATTTLIEAGDAKIIVNPGLPAQALRARMSERSPVRPEDITHVFLTAFVLDHYRGLTLFDRAAWLVHEPEREAAIRALEDQLARMGDDDDESNDGHGDDGDFGAKSGGEGVTDIVRDHLALLNRTRPAPDSIVPGVDLFPLSGTSPGTCGLLIATPAQTIIVCGDAIATSEHLEQGKVLPTCVDVEQAQESFREAVEIADVLILGRDNVAFNPLRRVM